MLSFADISYKQICSKVFNVKPFTGYNRSKFFDDLIAGFVVAIIALPLAIAFGIASGVSPQQGIIAGIVASILTAVFGSTNVQISGPTGSFLFMSLGLVTNYGYNGLAVAGIIAGLIIIAMGMLKLGDWMRFISTPLIVGFTAGLALNIISSQLADAMGVMKGAGSNSVIITINTLREYANISWTAVGLTILTIVVSELISQNLARIPGPFAALAISILLVYFFDLQVETIGSKFGASAFELPHFQLPKFSLPLVKELLNTSFAIAIVCGIESLLSAVVIDGITGYRHSPNKELIAQGLSNIVSPLFGGIPCSGVIARSTTAVQNGGTTPVAAIVQSIFLFIVAFVFSKVLSYIPLASLSGTLFIVAYNMSGWRKIYRILLSPLRDDKIILLVTLFTTIFYDVITAIEIGTVLSAFFFINQNFRLAATDCQIFQPQSAPNLLLKDQNSNIKHASNLADLDVEIPEDVTVFSLSGSLFFAAASKFDQVLRNIKTTSKYIILRMDNIQTIDLSGMDVLNMFIKDILKNGQQLFITEANKYCKKLLLSGNFKLENNQVFDSLKEAVKQINQIESAKNSSKEDKAKTTESAPDLEQSTNSVAAAASEHTSEPATPNPDAEKLEPQPAPNIQPKIAIRG